MNVLNRQQLIKNVSAGGKKVSKKLIIRRFSLTGINGDSESKFLSHQSIMKNKNRD